MVGGKQPNRSYIASCTIIAKTFTPYLSCRSSVFECHSRHTHIIWQGTAAGESFFLQDTGLTPAAPLLRGYAKVESLSVAENDFVLTASLAGELISSVLEEWLKVSWRRDGAMFIGQTVPRNFSTLSHLSHVCLATTLMQLVSPYTVWRCMLQMKPVKLCLSVLMGWWQNFTTWSLWSWPPFGWWWSQSGWNSGPTVCVRHGSKTYTFQVRVSSLNFTANHQTFTV